MRDALRRLSLWAAQRGSEPTTWCGIITALDHFAHHHSPADFAAALEMIGPVVCSAYLVMMREAQ